MLFDDCNRLIAKNDDIRYTFLSNCRTESSFYVVTSPHWLPNVTLVDPPSVAQHSSIQCALIRSSVCSIRIFHVRVIWQYTPSPAVHGRHRNNRVFTNSTLPSMFSDEGSALMWLRLSENVLDELKYSIRNIFRRLERLYSEMRTFLPNALLFVCLSNFGFGMQETLCLRLGLCWHTLWHLLFGQIRTYYHRWVFSMSFPLFLHYPGG